MAAAYRTSENEHWDEIAKSVYGSELYADYLMESNLKHVGTYAFAAGTELQTPDLPDDRVPGVLPPWRP